MWWSSHDSRVSPCARGSASASAASAASTTGDQVMAGRDSDQCAAARRPVPGWRREQRHRHRSPADLRPDSHRNRPRSMLSATMSSGALANQR